MEATDDHVRQLARERDPIGAIQEMIWNSLDAEATAVDVEIGLTETGAVDRVVVADNGHGMEPERCEPYFVRIGDSWKKTALTSPTLKRPLHGRFGHGRLRGYALGSFLRWITIADATKGRLRTTISAHDGARNDFEISDSEHTKEPAGTRFEAWGKQDASLNKLLSDNARKKVTVAFATYLTSYPDVQVTYNGELIDPQSAIDRMTEYSLGFSFDNTEHEAHIKVIEWGTKVNREIHLCEVNGLPLQAVDAGIQAPGFEFTAYVTWASIEDHLGSYVLEDEETAIGALIAAARDKMREHFKLRGVERRQQLVAKWQDQKVYPYEGEPSSEAERVERETFEVVATTISRNLPAAQGQKRVTLTLLKEALKHQPENMHRILDEVCRLGKADRDTLDGLLNRTTMSAIIKASSSVAARLDFLAALKIMVFDPETKKVVKERTQLHKILENETWVFGEQYSLLVSDRSLDTVLARHIELLRSVDEKLEPVRREDGTVGIVDLMLSRARVEHDRRRHLIVELKAPRVVVGANELNQIKGYATAVAEDPQFRDVSTEWDFWLITTQMTKQARIESHQADRSRGLAWDYADGDIKIRVWLKTWSEIIEECHIRMQYFKDHFDHDPSIEHALEYLSSVHGSRIPAGLVLNAGLRPPEGVRPRFGKSSAVATPD